MPKLRMYQPIWEKIKLGKVVRVAALPVHQARIRKAVWKEKDLDVAFKLEQLDTRKRVRLQIKCYDTYMTFQLVPQVSVGSLEDL